jgi:hypothetical protein
MMDKFTKAGLDPGKDPNDFGEDDGGGSAPTPAKPAPGAPGSGNSAQSEAERKAQAEANRARMIAAAKR